MALHVNAMHFGNNNNIADVVIVAVVAVMVISSVVYTHMFYKFRCTDTKMTNYSFSSSSSNPIQFSLSILFS